MNSIEKLYAATFTDLLYKKRLGPQKGKKTQKETVSISEKS